MRQFMETAQKMSCEEGQVLFHSGDATHHFYTLIQGEFHLTIGTSGQHVYTVRQAGDVFGWSSLVGGSLYSATAVCSRTSEVLRFDSESLERLLKSHPESGMLFYKKLAETIGKRLLKAYQSVQSEEDHLPQMSTDRKMAAQ